MTIVLRAANLIDGTGQPGIGPAEVHVDGKQIAYAGPAREAPPVPGNPQVVDLGQRTLLPGLIDCHAHPVSYGGGLGQTWPGQTSCACCTAPKPCGGRCCRARRPSATPARLATRRTRSRRPSTQAKCTARAWSSPARWCARQAATAGAAAARRTDPDEVRREVRDRFKNGATFIKLTCTGGGTVGTVRASSDVHGRGDGVRGEGSRAA